tara:strand:- start:228 stop:539 length:312 start_codon:yes stop_codon:yes gene_type:complete
MGMFYGSLNYTTSGRKRRRLSVKKNSPKAFVASTANKPKTYADVRRETDIKYPSRDDSTGSTPRQEPQQYTGTLVRGIATMHKSNAVPVTSDQQAIDISRMAK